MVFPSCGFTIIVAFVIFTDEVFAIRKLKSKPDSLKIGDGQVETDVKLNENFNKTFIGPERKHLIPSISIKNNVKNESLLGETISQQRTRKNFFKPNDVSEKTLSNTKRQFVYPLPYQMVQSTGFQPLVFVENPILYRGCSMIYDLV